jgi:D-galactarolactone isomerase
MKRPLTGRPPRLVAPAGAIDTHMHFYSAKYPKHPAGPPLPPYASIDEYRQVQRWLGIERLVIVQPNAYGNDNRCTMESVAELGKDVARAIVAVDRSVSDSELARLDAEGARGVRFQCLPGGFSQWDAMDEILVRIRPLGWHCIVQFDGRELPQQEAQLKRIPGDYIIDHIGKFLEPVATDHAAFKGLLRLVGRGNCYVKLAAPYETSKAGPPDYADVGALAKALVKAAPDRIIWASNWPHVSTTPETYPDDAGLLDLLLEWAPDEAVRRKVLVDNPARLYGF